MIVTAAMKKTGGEVLTGWESMYQGMTHDDDMAEAVFLAMWKVYLGPVLVCQERSR